MNDVFVQCARRTPVVPRGGRFSHLSLHELAAPVMRRCAEDSGVDLSDIDEVIAGNALYGGGNPARVMALAAGLPETVPAITIDRQCCSGLDAVGLAVAMIGSGQARTVLAGGAESFSRSALRFHRPVEKNQAPEPYDRPPFTPWSDRDPDMADAAAMLAVQNSVSRERQWSWAMDSHRKALDFRKNNPKSAEIVQIPGLPIGHDPFARNLTEDVCRRARRLSGDDRFGIDAATTAVEADAAAFLIVGDGVRQSTPSGPVFRILGYAVAGGDPALPGLAPIEAAGKLFARTGLLPEDFDRVEIMEAFAAQAIAFHDAFDLDAEKVNAGGGALARGHPIGASGAILLVRLMADLAEAPAGSRGLAAIAGAGGLGSAMAIRKV